MSDTLKERLASWWRDRRQVQKLASAGIVEAGEFEISQEYGQKLIRKYLTQISDRESAREALNLLCKLNIAGVAMTSNQLHQLLDHCIPYLQDVPTLDEWDELLFMFPDYGPEELKRLLGLLESRQDQREEPPTYLLSRILEQAPGREEIIDCVVRIIKDNPGHHSYLLNNFQDIREHPALQETIKNSRSVYNMSILLKGAGPQEWQEVFHKLLRLNPDYAIKKIEVYPPPEGVELTEKELLPALTSSKKEVRQKALRALGHFQKLETSFQDTRKPDR